PPSTRTAQCPGPAGARPVPASERRNSGEGRWLKADAALIRAERADRHGNLTYRKAARNFSPLMAMAARLTVVQAREIVAPGGIDPEHVVTPGIFVDRIVEVAHAAQEEALIRDGVEYP